jgi:hypothetical protein
MKLLSIALSVAVAKNTKKQDKDSDYNGDYDGPPIQLQFRDGLGSWGFGSFVNPFASLIEPEKKTDSVGSSDDDYASDESSDDYGNDYGVVYDYYDYDDFDEDYEGNLEGFNITMFEDSAAVQRVQAAVTMHESFDFRGGGFGSINEGPNSPGVQAASAKRIQMLMKMIMYLQADPSFDKFFQYGCWCFPDGEKSVLGGYGEAKDGADQVCKKYHNCQRCVDHDYVDCPEWAPYRYSGKIDKATGKKVLKCNNKPGTCRRNHCECDKKLAEDLAEFEMVWNPTLSLQMGGFDRTAECPSGEKRSNSGNDNEHSCCGVYPERYPYVSQNQKGDTRKCCLTKTYDPRVLACCQHHELKEVGTCFEPCEKNPVGVHCQ